MGTHDDMATVSTPKRNRPGTEAGPTRAEIHAWMLDASEDPIVVIAPDDRFSEVNLAYARSVGRPREALVGASVIEVVGHKVFAEFVQPALVTCRTTGRADYWMNRTYRHDLTVRQHVQYCRIYWPGSSMPYVLVVARQDSWCD